MSEALYTATATSTGGGRNGRVVTSDNTLDLEVRPPRELGGSGEGTNPEQLVAAGWAACFNGALQLMMKNAGFSVEQTPEVTVNCSLSKDPEDGGFRVDSTIKAVIFGVTDEQAAELVAKAHEFCPYSKAFRGNTTATATAEAR